MGFDMQLVIRKIGNSAGVVIPAPVLEQLNASVGTSLDANVQGGQLTLSAAKPRYTLTELLAQCDPNAPVSVDVQDWQNTKPVGNEVW